MVSCRLFSASSSHSFFHFHPLPHSSATLSSSFSLPASHSSLFKPRVSLQLEKLPSFRLVQNGVTPRAYMSSLSTAETSQKSESSKAYGSDQIQVLEGLDPVRKRPEMYIGSTGPRGLHHLIYEILDNIVDEAQAGFVSKIDVVLQSDGSVSIIDDDRGEEVAATPPKLQVIKAKARARSSSTPSASTSVAVSVETIKGTSSAIVKKLANFMTFVPTPSFKHPKKNDKPH